MSDIRRAEYSSHHLLETAEVRLICGVCFTVFLLGAILSRLAPWLGEREAGRNGSVFAQARAVTDRTIPFIFMG
jgi:hypothetical protein